MTNAQRDEMLLNIDARSKRQDELLLNIVARNKRQDELLLNIQNTLLTMQADDKRRDEKIASIDERLGNVEEKVSVLDERVSGMDKRVFKIEDWQTEIEAILLHMQFLDEGRDKAISNIQKNTVQILKKLDSFENRFKSDEKILDNHNSRIVYLESKVQNL